MNISMDAKERTDQASKLPFTPMIHHLFNAYFDERIIKFQLKTAFSLFVKVLNICSFKLNPIFCKN